ncbi:odorant receptor 65a-like [Anthonomus grandis grandis]|uniref:odorant receptor 65a-like n=1 Tax=Anthonomus grandis grandis TaxID=2921223 RepID=UPI0021669DC3|nr:odorant receptor 65a-like [Anthonomus grandis grandis]
MRTWSNLFLDITNTSKFGIPPNMGPKAKKVQLYIIFFIAYCNWGVCTYALASIFLESVTCEKINKEKGLHEICGMVTPFWWPYDTIDFYLKMFFNAYEILCIGIYIPPGVSLIVSVWECAETIISKIEHLKEMFKETFEIEELHLQQAHLRRCIQYHQEIIKIIQNWNTENKKCFGQCSSISAITISLITAQFLRIHSIGALIHVFGYTVGVFMLCKAGQMIQDESYNIQDAFLDSKWYTASPKLLKDIKFVILRCQKPLYLQAVPFGTFNFNSLIMIIKTAYSYLTLINNESKYTKI